MTGNHFLFVVVKYTRSLGASEDLVVAVAERLAAAGGRAPAFWFNFRPSESDDRIRRLRVAGCPIHFYDASRPSLRLRRRFFGSTDRPAIGSSLRSVLNLEKPARVILNQGGNSDASVEAPVLKQAGIPYAVLCHAATESSWPGLEFLPAMRAIFTGAKLCFFVSEMIWRLTEAQLGQPLENASVVYNPCKFSMVQHSPWPEDQSRFSLAVVSRIENKQKGHDLILQALARPEWRKRPLSVTFYGEGPHREPLESYANALGLDSVHFAGHVNDIKAIWQRHHGFIQASRYEGYGLSLLEALFCERMAIATPFPAATEFITDGETGFLARAASVDEVALVLERAWVNRDRWQEMGVSAAQCVQSGYPKDPVGDFLDLIRQIN